MLDQYDTQALITEIDVRRGSVGMVKAIREYLESLTDSSEAIGDDEARKEYDADARKALESFVSSEATAV